MAGVHLYPLFVHGRTVIAFVIWVIVHANWPAACRIAQFAHAALITT